MQSTYHQDKTSRQHVSARHVARHSDGEMCEQKTSSAVMNTADEWMRLVLVQRVSAVHGQGTSRSDTKTGCFWYLLMFLRFWLNKATKVQTKEHSSLKRNCSLELQLRFLPFLL